MRLSTTMLNRLFIQRRMHNFNVQSQLGNQNVPMADKNVPMADTQGIPREMSLGFFVLMLVRIF